MKNPNKLGPSIPSMEALNQIERQKQEEKLLPVKYVKSMLMQPIELTRYWQQCYFNARGIDGVSQLKQYKEYFKHEIKIFTN